MDNIAPPTFDPNALTFRNYVNAASSSSQSIPSYQELMVLQQELQHLSEKANARFERFNNELARLEGGNPTNSITSKESSMPSTPTSTSSVSAAGFNSSSQAHSSSAIVVPPSGRASASPVESSPSSFSGSSRATGQSGAQTSGIVAGVGSSSKPGVVTLKLKRSDAPESGKADDDQGTSSMPNTIKIRTGLSAQDNALKKRKKRDLDDESEYSDDDRVSHSKAKRGDDYLTKVGRSMSPQPVKPSTSRNNTPKASQQKTGDKAHSTSQQKKKKNSEHHTEKTQKPPPKSQEVQEDFSKVKVANQIPIQTFWSSMDPYFRHFTEADRAILEEEGDQITPLMIPPLGKHYLEVWAEEERSLMPFDGFNSRRNSVDSTKEVPPSRNIVSSTPFELTDENIDQDEVSCGPLTERIICSLIAEDVDSKLIKQDDEPGPSGINSQPRNYAELEERVKRELRYIGLLGNEEIDWDAREDDEISIQLRSLQKELRDVIKVNKSRKQKLLGLVNNHLAYQEYNTILDDLDKQVEQGYLKRFRMTKSKKKKTSTPKSLSENALSAMDRRRRFVQGVGPIFPPESYSIPTKSIYDEEPPRPSSTVQTYRQMNGLS